LHSNGAEFLSFEELATNVLQHESIGNMSSHHLSAAIDASIVDDASDTFNVTLFCRKIAQCQTFEATLSKLLSSCTTDATLKTGVKREAKSLATVAAQAIGELLKDSDGDTNDKTETMRLLTTSSVSCFLTSGEAYLIANLNNGCSEDAVHDFLYRKWSSQLFDVSAFCYIASGSPGTKKDTFYNSYAPGVIVNALKSQHCGPIDVNKVLQVRERSERT